MRYKKVNLGKKCSLHLFILNASDNEHYLIVICSLYLSHTFSDVLKQGKPWQKKCWNKVREPVKNYLADFFR